MTGLTQTRDISSVLFLQTCPQNLTLLLSEKVGFLTYLFYGFLVSFALKLPVSEHTLQSVFAVFHVTYLPLSAVTVL